MFALTTEPVSQSTINFTAYWTEKSSHHFHIFNLAANEVCSQTVAKKSAACDVWAAFPCCCKFLTGLAFITSRLPGGTYGDAGPAQTGWTTYRCHDTFKNTNTTTQTDRQDLRGLLRASHIEHHLNPLSLQLSFLCLRGNSCTSSHVLVRVTLCITRSSACCTNQSFSSRTDQNKLTHIIFTIWGFFFTMLIKRTDDEEPVQTSNNNTNQFFSYKTLVFRHDQ